MSILHAEYTELLKTCRIPDEASPHCKLIDCDSIFAETNEEEESLAEQRALANFNNGHALLRFEFIQCLVRLSIAKYVKNVQQRRARHKATVIKDLSEAVDYLLIHNIEGNVPPEAKHDSDVFRHTRLYTYKAHL